MSERRRGATSDRAAVTAMVDNDTAPAPARRSFLRSRVVLVAAVIAALVGLYALLGFYAAPRLVRSQAVDFVRETYGRELAIGEVRVQPFKLQAEVRDLALPDADGAKLLGFRRLFVDFELASLWHRAWVFRDVVVEAPYLSAVIREDGALNLADLALPDDPEPAEDEPLPALWLQSFTLADGSIDFADRARRVPFEHEFAPVSFALRDFRTTPEGGGFSLAARGRNDEQLQWQGRFALAPQIASQGEFSLTELKVPRLAELLGDAVPFGLPSGTLALAGTYSVTLSEPMALEIKVPTLTASGLALRAQGVAEDWVEIPTLTVAGTQVTLPAQKVDVQSVTLEGMKAQVWLEPDGTMNVDRLFAGPAPEPSSISSPDAGEADGAEWQVAVGAVEVREASVAIEDRTVQPAAKFALAPLALTVRDASLDLTRPVPVTWQTVINGQGRAQGNGTVVPETAAVAFDIELSGLPLADLQPYAEGPTDLTIRAGTVDARGRFTMSPPGGGEPEMAFAGDVAMAGFRSIDAALEQDFLNFERVELAKLEFALAPDSMRIDRVQVVRPFARVIVSSDGILNAAAVFDPEGTAAAAAQAKAAAAAKAAESSRKKTRAEIRAERKAAAAAAKARAKAPAPPEPELRETGMPIRVREVVVRDGTLDFADYSVQPNFAATVGSLAGSIQGVSSDPNSRAKVDLKGNVGEFSPVQIAGSVQPFAYDRYTDIGLRFENISLPIFNPYSGKFAGYAIAKGKLTTDLHYTVESRRLNAQHRIRIDQLEWGEATAARGEATLPVKFATALLKDADGVISLDVPVQGTLDDPKFKVGPIVWQIVKNILTKAVTAPFKALGALFKGAEEAQFVEFAPGEAALDPAAAERLAQLGRSLAPKPDLKLDVPIGGDAALDGEALAQARFERELGTALASGKRGKRDESQVSATQSFAALDPEGRIEVLRVLYTQLSGAEPAVPEAVPVEDASRKERKAQAQQAELEWLEAESRKRATPLPGELEQLGRARGEAIQKALLTDTGLTPDRVFLADNGKVAANEGRVRFELQVK